ncbi:hypothetical protein HDU93_002928, partial [Gonapodya sp. JEL0774]
PSAPTPSPLSLSPAPSGPLYSIPPRSLLAISISVSAVIFLAVGTYIGLRIAKNRRKDREWVVERGGKGWFKRGKKYGRDDDGDVVEEMSHGGGRGTGPGVGTGSGIGVGAGAGWFGSERNNGGAGDVDLVEELTSGGPGPGAGPGADASSHLGGGGTT